MAEQKPFDIEQYIRGKSMSRFEEQLKAFAIKMSRGDKLSTVEEKEYKRILEQYKSVNTAYNKAMAEGQKILDATPGLQPGEEVAAPKDTDKDGIPDSIDATPGNVGQTPPPVTPPKGDTPGTPPKGGNQTPPKVPGPTDAQQREEALGVAASQDFALPETIFNNVPSLKAILDRYVKEDWTPDKLRKAIRDDVWYRKNSAEIKARYVQLYNYRDLVATGQADLLTTRSRSQLLNVRLLIRLELWVLVLHQIQQHFAKLLRICTSQM